MFRKHCLHYGLLVLALWAIGCDSPPVTSTSAQTAQGHAEESPKPVEAVVQQPITPQNTPIPKPDKTASLADIDKAKSYIVEMLKAKDNLLEALGDVETTSMEYGTDRDVLNNSEWRGRMRNATGKLLTASVAFENLSAPSNGLEKADLLLRQSGKEYHLATDALGTFIAKRDSDWLGTSADHLKSGEALMRSAAAALHEYNEKRFNK